MSFFLLTATYDVLVIHVVAVVVTEKLRRCYRDVSAGAS